MSRSRPRAASTASASPALSRSVAAGRADGAHSTATPLAELRRWMANRHLDALCITRPVSIAYLTGFEANPHERLMALAVRSNGATLIVPALEQEKANARATNANIVAWRDGEDAYEMVTRALAGLNEV